MSERTLPSGIGDSRMLFFLKSMRDAITELKAQQSGSGGLENRIAALETSLNTESTGIIARVETLNTTVNAATTGLVDRVTALETPGA